MTAPAWARDAVREALRVDARREVARRWAERRCEVRHDSFATCYACTTWALARVARMSDALAEAAGLIVAWLTLMPSAQNLATSGLALIVQDGSGQELVWPVAGSAALGLSDRLSEWAREHSGQVIVTTLGDEHVHVRPHTFFARWPEA